MGMVDFQAKHDMRRCLMMTDSRRCRTLEEIRMGMGMVVVSKGSIDDEM